MVHHTEDEIESVCGYDFFTRDGYTNIERHDVIDGLAHPTSNLDISDLPFNPGPDFW